MNGGSINFRICTKEHISWRSYSNLEAALVAVELCEGLTKRSIESGPSVGPKGIHGGPSEKEF